MKISIRASVRRACFEESIWPSRKGKPWSSWEEAGRENRFCSATPSVFFNRIEGASWWKVGRSRAFRRTSFDRFGRPSGCFSRVAPCSIPWMSSKTWRILCASTPICRRKPSKRGSVRSWDSSSWTPRWRISCPAIFRAVCGSGWRLPAVSLWTRRPFSTMSPRRGWIPSRRTPSIS